MYYKVITKDPDKMYEVFCLIYPELGMSFDELFCDGGRDGYTHYEMGIDMNTGEHYIWGSMVGLSSVWEIANTCFSGPLDSKHRKIVYDAMSKLTCHNNTKEKEK